MKIMWNRKTICTALYKDNSYYFDAIFPNVTSQTVVKSARIASILRHASHTADLMTWHRQLAHLNNKSVHLMATTGMVQGMAITHKNISGKCVDCINGKLKAKPFTANSID